MRPGYSRPVRWVAVPYHLDEYLPDLDLPIAAADVVAADLGGGDPWARMAVLYAGLADVVAGAVTDGAVPLVLSGDCTSALGTVAGLQRAGLAVGLVWLDAHGDLHTPCSTSSGYLGGMPLRLLVGACPELIGTSLGLRAVPEDRVLLVGARDLDPPESSFLAGAAISMCDVAALDPAALNPAALNPAALPDGPLYVHLDADVMDAAEIPGLRYPAPGGPGRAAVAEALRNLVRTGRVAAVGLACTWRPGEGAAAAIAPVLAALA
jgi:arginase